MRKRRTHAHAHAQGTYHPALHSRSPRHTHKLTRTRQHKRFGVCALRTTNGGRVGHRHVIGIRRRGRRWDDPFNTLHPFSPSIFKISSFSPHPATFSTRATGLRLVFTLIHFILITADATETNILRETRPFLSFSSCRCSRSGLGETM